MWESLMLTLQKTYNNLSHEEKENCWIWGDTYSWASGVNLYADNYDLPQAFSFHGSHYLWLPDLTINSTAIAIFNTKDTVSYKERIWSYGRFYESVELVEQIFNPYANDESKIYFNIYICRGLKYNRETFLEKMEYRIFE